MAHILIAGLPGAGKSSYCHWLAEHHGYVHIDVDHCTNDEVVLSLKDQRPGAVVASAKLMRAKGQDVVLDWGFPSERIGQVRNLGYEAIDHWWLGGDEDAAHQSFTARGTVDEATHRVQMQGIHRRWPQLTNLFRSNMIDVISPGPVFMSPEDIYRVMFGDGSHG